jgi:hypothetical protein
MITIVDDRVLAIQSRAATARDSEERYDRESSNFVVAFRAIRKMEGISPAEIWIATGV